MLFCAALGFGLAPPAAANFVTELSYDDRVRKSEYVVIGTVQDVTPVVPDRYESTARVTVRAVIKGQPDGELTVLRESPVAELDPQCCEVGATYLMFLARATQGGALYPVGGRQGMMRLGPAKTPEVQVIRPRR